jgi:hypothetical protein
MGRKATKDLQKGNAMKREGWSATGEVALIVGPRWWWGKFSPLQSIMRLEVAWGPVTYVDPAVCSWW